MELDSHELAHMPMPITSSYGHGHAHLIREAPARNLVINPPPPPPPPPSSLHPAMQPNCSMEDQALPYKKTVKYRECLRNHAASMGGNSTDGCGEFMPNGEEGTLEALTCSACSCHRNFHRKDVDGEGTEPNTSLNFFRGRKMVGQKGVLIAGSNALGYHITRPHPQMMLSYNTANLPSESDEMEGRETPLPRPSFVKKRFRTKFTAEQKEKMLNFAEKVGWRMQKQEEGLIQQLCNELGIKRRVLKVWMHNNKHTMAKKGSPPPLDY